MCVTLGPGDLFGTSICAGVLPTGMHFFFYENTALTFGKGPNMMIIAVPTKRLVGEDLINCEKMPNILGDMRRAVQPPLTRSSKSFSLGSFEVVSVGIYTVVIAQSVAAVPAAMQSLPPALRPEINNDVLDSYNKMYPGWPLTLWIWEGNEAQQSQPIGVTYKPLKPHQLYFPGTDAHDGRPPKEGFVEVDHWLFASHPAMKGGNTVEYTESFTPRLEEILPKRVLGKYFNKMMYNGDFWLSVPSLKEGRWDLYREAPPGGFVPQKLAVVKSTPSLLAV